MPVESPSFAQDSATGRNPFVAALQSLREAVRPGLATANVDKRDDSPPAITERDTARINKVAHAGPKEATATQTC